MTYRPIWVTIPTIGHSELLIPLLRDLEQDRYVNKILLTVNLEEYVEPLQNFFRPLYEDDDNPLIEIVPTWERGKSLHHGWNAAIHRARDANAWLAVLNDDIRLVEPLAMSSVARHMGYEPDYAVVGLNWLETAEETQRNARPIGEVHGTYRNHGVGGFAWVCDPHKVTTVPDSLVWWYGDDHIVLSAEKVGHKVGIASHVHVEHAHALTANSGEHDWVNAAIESDVEVFRRLWPEG